MIQRGYDEALAKSIAKDSGSAQFRADVSLFCRLKHIGHPVTAYYYDESAVIVGYYLKGNNYRILGIGTREQDKGKGYATALLKVLEREVVMRGGAEDTHLNQSRRGMVLQAWV